jgi:hypothetical protein
MCEVFKNLMKQNLYWKNKSELLEVCFKNEKFDENEIKNTIKKYIASNQKFMKIINLSKSSNRFFSKQNFEFLNIYNEKWTDYLISQYNHVTQSLEMITSENEDEEIYFYDDEAFLHYLSKIKQDKNSNFENNMIQIEFLDLEILELETEFDNFGEITKEEKIEKYINNKGFESEIYPIALSGLPIGLRSSVYIKYFQIKKKKNVFDFKTQLFNLF